METRRLKAVNPDGCKTTFNATYPGDYANAGAGVALTLLAEPGADRADERELSWRRVAAVDARMRSLAAACRCIGFTGG